LDARTARRRSGTASLTFTPAERRLIARLNTPLKVQRYLNALPYNREPPPGRATLRSFRGVVKHHTVHCLEAALFAATVLEQHGYPPLVISFESIDELDHVLFAYQSPKSRVQSPESKVQSPKSKVQSPGGQSPGGQSPGGQSPGGQSPGGQSPGGQSLESGVRSLESRVGGRWGSVARSRDPGLHGRKPVFATPRALATSYLDTYVDLTGRITAFTLVDLRVMGSYDWRLSDKNVWKVERMLLDTPHQPLRMPEARFRAFRKRYRAFKEKYPDRKPLFYENRRQWTPLPKEFLKPLI
jgi:hypothetical protein